MINYPNGCAMNRYLFSVLNSAFSLRWLAQVLIIFIALIGLSSCAQKKAPPSVKVDFAERVQNPKQELLEMLQQDAQKGDAEAQYYLGSGYLKGDLVEQSDEKAVIWFKKSAKQGYAKAQHDLSYMYFKGRGVKQSDSKAVYWLKKAAAQGHKGAQKNLKFMRDKGRAD